MTKIVITIDEDAITSAYLKAVGSGMTTGDVRSFLVSSLASSIDVKKFHAIKRLTEIFDNLQRQGFDAAVFSAQQRARDSLRGIVSSSLED